MGKNLIEMKGIHKYFGNVKALKGVDLEIGEKEIIGLVGDNGAGKSTLIKILTGFLKASDGKIFVNGKEAKIKSPAEARKMGIETVYQEQALADDLSISRNLFLGKEIVKEIGPFKFLDHNQMRQESRKMLDELQLRTDPEQETRYCSGGERQGVSIARAIYFRANLVILDEPTNSLGVAAVERVLSLIKELKQRGISCIFISHNLYHVYSVVDRIVILINGTKVGDYNRDEISVDEINNLLVKRSGSYIN